MEERIQTAIADGKLTGERADKALEMLAKAREVEAAVQAAVDAGEMTAEEGEKKLQAMLRRIFPGPKDGPGRKGPPPPPMDLDKMEERIQTAIADGKLTGEKAEEMLAALAKGREAEAAVQASVDAGEMTAEEGERRLQAALRKIFPGPKDGRGRKGPPPKVQQGG